MNESCGYDAVGNMTSRNGLPLSYGDAAHKHAVTAYAGVSYAYDACGNLTARGSTAFQYSAENRLSKVSAGGTACRYTYDGDGHRTKRLDANGTVHYVGDYERNVGAGDGAVVVTKYYRALGRLIAFRKGGVLHWVGSDHLGGTVRTLDASFNVVDGMRYRPYGSDRDAGTDLRTDRKFTGQTEDAVSGLYFYTSRYYDAHLGRFVQPDTIVPDPSNPQSLNRYSYVLNNPIKFTDPTGRTAAPPPDMRTHGTVADPIPERVGGEPNITWTGPPVRSGPWIFNVGQVERQRGGFVVERARRGPYINTDGEFGQHSGIHAADEGSGVARGQEAIDELMLEERRILYRQGTQSPSNLTPRPKDQGVLSTRNSLSNPYPLPEDARPVLETGKDFIAIDAEMLPPGSVEYDGKPEGHAGIRDVPAEETGQAVVARHRFPRVDAI